MLASLSAAQQVLLLLAGVTAALLLSRRQGLREALKVLATGFYRTAARATARVAWVVDHVIPISMWNEKPVLWRGAVWLGANIAVAAAGMNIERVPGGGALAVLALLTVLVVFNIVFLLAPRMGLDEEGAIAHRHIRYEDRLFGRLYGERNISSARNPWIVGIATVAFVIQLATLLHLGEEYFQVGWVEVKESTGLRLADMSIALLTSTVLHNVMFGLPDKICIVNAGISNAVGFFATSVIWFAFWGFVRRTGAARRLLDAYRARTDERALRAMEEQFHMGPSMLRGEIAAAYRSTSSNEEREKLLHLLVDVRPTYTAPAIFLGSYRRTAEPFRTQGGEKVIRFLIDRRHQVRRIRPDENHRSHFKCATGQGAGNRRR